MEFTHSGLIERNDAEFTRLVESIDPLPAERLDEEFAGDGRDRNVRDVVAHLHAWHILLEKWYADGEVGGTPAIPAEGYTWRELAALNEELRQQWQHTSLPEVLALLRASHQSLQAMVALHTDDELADPGAYAWTQGAPLGEFAWECGGAHYEWARRTIEAGLGLESRE